MDFPMLESFDINSSIKKYSVEITQAPKINRTSSENTYLLVDALVLSLWPMLKHSKTITIDATEQTKTLETVASVIEQLRNLGANRDSHLIAVGGGIIQDVATFVASSYMRGISWSYYPSTMLGMCDSCIGGKSSINVGQYKNIAGNFYPPTHISVATDFHKTLEKNEVIAGLFEAVKICFSSTDDSFDRYLTLAGNGLNETLSRLPQLIELSLKTKRKFIEEDEFDQGVRLLLNFGHTFGHAIEGATNFIITHGVAVGLGMLSAIHLATQKEPTIANNRRVLQLKKYIISLLTQADGLSDSLKKLDSRLALDKFRSDKKHKNGFYTVIIPNVDGWLDRTYYVVGAETDNDIINAFEALKGEYEVQ